MAHVGNTRLHVRGDRQSGQGFAAVTFDLWFSAHEVSQNIDFGLFIGLMERDDRKDTYHWVANGSTSVSFNWRSLDELDDFVGWITEGEQINPGGKNQLLVRRESDMDYGQGREGQYSAFIWVIPEVVQGFGWTDETQGTFLEPG